MKNVEMHCTILNFTPHTVTLLGANMGPEVFESRGVARCQEIVRPLAPLRFDPFMDGGMVFEAPLVSKSFGAVQGLPAYNAETPWRMYIVSQIVADACPERDDLLVPTDVVRDAGGQVLGCRGFSWRPARIVTSTDVR